MADLLASDGDLILDLTVRRPKLSVTNNRPTDTVSDITTTSDVMDWEGNTCAGVPLMGVEKADCQPGYGLDFSQRLGGDSLADNRSISLGMDWDDSTSASLFCTHDSSHNNNNEKTLPFKKRWAHLHHCHPHLGLEATDGRTSAMSLPLDLDCGRATGLGVLEQKSLSFYRLTRADRTPPPDGVTILAEDLAAMHTNPPQPQQHLHINDGHHHHQQQQDQHQQLPVHVKSEEHEASLDSSDLCPLRNRGVSITTTSECDMTPDRDVQGSRLSPDNSKSTAFSNIDVTEIDFSEEECNAVRKPDEDGDLPIHIAAVQGELEIVARLVLIMTKICVSIDEMNNLKQTPLHLATMTRHDDIVKLLLEAGASPNIPDRKGNTCCHQAVRKNATSCLEVIMKHSKEKANINAKNFEGMTPLHEAVKLSNLDCIELLIKYGAKINIVDGKSGKTPLYLAFECNKTEAANKLLSHGADINIPTYSGCTLLQAANDRGQKLLNNSIRTLQGWSLPKSGRKRQRIVKSNTSF